MYLILQTLQGTLDTTLNLSWFGEVTELHHIVLRKIIAFIDHCHKSNADFLCRVPIANRIAKKDNLRVLVGRGNLPERLSLRCL